MSDLNYYSDDGIDDPADSDGPGGASGVVVVATSHSILSCALPASPTCPTCHTRCSQSGEPNCWCDAKEAQ